jgi:ADP-heptose:LPS heptosyltransferase
MVQALMSLISPQRNPEINTIAVIVGRDLVGDALIKLPFARALREAWPKARIQWVTSQNATAFSTILRDATRHLIDDIHETPAWLTTTTRQATETPPTFDLILDTRNRWKEAVLAKRIPHKIFIAMALRHLLSDRHPNILKAKPPHLCDRLLLMVELAAGYLPPSTGALPVPQELIDKARLLLPPGKTYVGLAPGAGNKIKIWPRGKFEQLASAQAAKGRVPVFVLGPQELSWRDVCAAHVPSALFPLQEIETWGTAQLTIDHTLALAKLLDIAVANDSGTGHMFAAVDCPIISLFGPTSATKCAPRSSRVTTLRAQDFDGSDHMYAIPWESVDKTIDSMLTKV